MGRQLARVRRLFFALWPTDEFRAEIQAATSSIVQTSGGRPIPPRNLHVTLLFLGQVSAETFAAVQQAGAQLTGSPAFELSFDAVESWGRKVLCLTSSTPPVAAIDLAERLRSSLNDRLQLGDAREFRPHITLARDLPRGRAVQKVETLAQQANDFVLVESVRDSAGSHYTVLERWPLQAPLAPTPNPTVADCE